MSGRGGVRSTIRLRLGPHQPPHFSHATPPHLYSLATPHAPRSCESLHLVADRLGYFEDGSWDIERAMAEKGGTFRRIDDENVLELDPADFKGVDKGGAKGPS